MKKCESSHLEQKMNTSDKASSKDIKSPIARGTKTRTANMKKRRAQILACAGDIIAQDGFDSLTLSKLATKAQVTVPTIHNLIGKKEQIYELLVDQMVVSIEDALSAQDVSDPITSAETFINQLIALFRENESLYKAAFVAGERISFFNQITSNGIYMRSLKLAKQICFDGVKNGYLEGNIDGEQMAWQIFACQRIARYDWMNGYIDLDTYRTNVLTGMYISYGMDATPKFKKRLIEKIQKLNNSKVGL